MARWVICSDCDGYSVIECDSCEGSGYNIYRETEDDDEFCEECGGEGSYECDACFNEGGWYEDNEGDDD